MKRITILAAGLLLALSASASGGRADEPVKPTWDKTSFTLRVIFLSPRATALKCARFGAWGGNERGALEALKSGPVGCARILHDENVCEVYVSRPETVNDAKTGVLGHEVLHCITGKYHD
jgi:hypothetical protein